MDGGKDVLRQGIFFKAHESNSLYKALKKAVIFSYKNASSCFE
jgi:hypothetical protein